MHRHVAGSGEVCKLLPLAKEFSIISSVQKLIHSRVPCVLGDVFYA